MTQGKCTCICILKVTTFHFMRRLGTVTGMRYCIKISNKNIIRVF